MNNPHVLLFLRLVHVVFGVLWAGGAVALAAFVVPAARRSDAGVSYLRQLIWTQNLPRYLNVSLVLAVLSGAAMYTNLVVITHGAWARSRVGMALGVGGAAALVAAVIATFVAAPAIHRALELAQQAPAGEELPTRRAEVDRALGRYAASMWVVAGLLIVTAAMMGIARYL